MVLSVHSFFPPLRISSISFFRLYCYPALFRCKLPVLLTPLLSMKNPQSLLSALTQALVITLIFVGCAPSFPHPILESTSPLLCIFQCLVCHAPPWRDLIGLSHHVEKWITRPPSPRFCFSAVPHYVVFSFFCVTFRY